MTHAKCPFCGVAADRIVLENSVGIVLKDAFPVSRGHTLVVPRQHVESLFDLPPADQVALWQLVTEARQQLVSELAPDGFNIGVNDGRAAGQTVAHAHIHIIPRRAGDAADPRGGIRWVLPDQARYW